LTAPTATPCSPIIDSRPIVGVENRDRTIPAMPPIMNSGVPTVTTTHGRIPGNNPSP
jgi:hypothetical protein